jgi:hypothetical protein
MPKHVSATRSFESNWRFGHRGIGPLLRFGRRGCVNCPVELGASSDDTYGAECPLPQRALRLAWHWPGTDDPRPGGAAILALDAFGRGVRRGCGRVGLGCLPPLA